MIRFNDRRIRELCRYEVLKSLNVALIVMYCCCVSADGDEKKKPPSLKEAAYRPASVAAELPRIPPRSPVEAMKSFQLHSAFKLELAAAEPLLASPVAVDFDEDGNLYVAEFPEFNQASSRQPQGRGRVKLLKDTDGDGVFDRSTIFLDQVDCPTAVCCYGGGVFVGAVPDILFAKDTTADGVADQRRVVFTGFARDVGGEAMLNSFRWTLDNRIHVQTSLSGGSIRHAERNESRSLSVRGQVFVFDPRTEEFESTSGGGQHGMALDDWGRTFVNTNTDPAHLVMYENRYIARNPYLEAPPATIKIADGGYKTKVKRLSPNEPWRVVRTRWRTTGVVDPHPTEGTDPSGFFTAVSGVTIYRGDAWPNEFRGNLFVGEVANNLVFRARLETKGLELTAMRVDHQAEFLASSDIWFRPVQMANGPDGALYVIDMYRHLIQAAAFMPESIVEHLDVSGGYDMGRLYRVAPKDFVRRKVPQLSQATTAQLCELLQHPNGWHRETAARLLYERQDRSAIATLVKMVGNCDVPLGRMHALYALDGLRGLDRQTVLAALGDLDSHVRRHAIRLAERFAADPEVEQRLVAQVDDPDASVRYQLAFSLGEFASEQVTRSLAKLVVRDGSDRWCRLAFLSSSNERASGLLKMLLGNSAFSSSHSGRETLDGLVKLVGRAGRPSEIAQSCEALCAIAENETELHDHLVLSLARILPAANRHPIATSSSGNQIQQTLDRLVRAAIERVENGNLAADARAESVRTLEVARVEQIRPLMVKLLDVRQPLEVQSAAIELVARCNDRELVTAVISAFPKLSPSTRGRAIEALLSRPQSTAMLLDAVEQGPIKRADLDPARVQFLRTQISPELRGRAEAIFSADATAGRAEAVARYMPAASLQGDVQRGGEVFKKHCSACHQLQGIGSQIGANLNNLRDLSREIILLNILDPNREVKPQFLNYVVSTADGRTVAGMIASETPTNLTFHKSDGTSEIVLRIDIEQMRSTGLSFMPEGLEQQIDINNMADLLAYLKSVK